MRKFSVLLLSLIISLFPVLQVNASNYELLERNESNNYGVKKNIKVTNARLQYILDAPYVSNSKNHVYDFADLLTDQEEEQIKELAADLKSELNTEIVIYIISDQSAYNYEKEDDMAQDFYDYNDFGMDIDEQYSGVLLLINKLNNGSVYSGGYMNCHAYGNAQLILNSSRLSNMVTKLEGNMWSGKYYATAVQFLNLVEDYYEQGSWDQSGDYYLDEDGMLQVKKKLPVVEAFIISGVITFIVILILVKKNKMVKKAENASGYLDKNDSRIEVSNDNFIRQTHHSYVVSSSSGGGGGGGSSRGSSGRGSSRGGGSRR